jgi:hypothetical protein
MPVCFHTFYSVFSFSNKERRGREKSENERMLKFFIYDLKEGELCKVLFYCSLKNGIMMLFYVKRSNDCDNNAKYISAGNWLGR